eukprot:1613591-Rhodomonas_salina.2
MARTFNFQRGESTQGAENKVLAPSSTPFVNCVGAQTKARRAEQRPAWCLRVARVAGQPGFQKVQKRFFYLGLGC